MYERETGKVKPECAELKELEPYGELGVELLERERNGTEKERRGSVLSLGYVVPREVPVPV
jgi:ribosome-binding protein aMBF1 (putative translation factor)